MAFLLDQLSSLPFQENLFIPLFQHFRESVDTFHASFELTYATVKYHLIPDRVWKVYCFYLWEQGRVDQWLSNPTESQLRGDVVLFQIVARMMVMNHQYALLLRWAEWSHLSIGYRKELVRKLQGESSPAQVRGWVIRQTAALYVEFDQEYRPPTLDWTLCLFTTATRSPISS
jgi:hypothetical protein